MISGIDQKDHKRLLKYLEKALSREMRSAERKNLERQMRQLLSSYEECETKIKRLEKAIQKYRDSFQGLRAGISSILRKRP